MTTAAADIGDKGSFSHHCDAAMDAIRHLQEASRLLAEREDEAEALEEEKAKLKRDISALTEEKKRLERSVSGLKDQMRGLEDEAARQRKSGLALGVVSIGAPPDSSPPAHDGEPSLAARLVETNSDETDDESGGAKAGACTDEPMKEADSAATADETRGTEATQEGGRGAPIDPPIDAADNEADGIALSSVALSSVVGNRSSSPPAAAAGTETNEADAAVEEDTPPAAAPRSEINETDKAGTDEAMEEAESGDGGDAADDSNNNHRSDAGPGSTEATNGGAIEKAAPTDEAGVASELQGSPEPQDTPTNEEADVTALSVRESIGNGTAIAETTIEADTDPETTIQADTDEAMEEAAPGVGSYDADEAETGITEEAVSAVVAGAGEAMDGTKSGDGGGVGGLHKDEAGTTEATPEPPAGAVTHAAETDVDDTPAYEATDKEGSDVSFSVDKARVCTGVDDAAVPEVAETERAGGDGTFADGVSGMEVDEAGAAAVAESVLGATDAAADGGRDWDADDEDNTDEDAPGPDNALTRPTQDDLCNAGPMPEGPEDADMNPNGAAFPAGSVRAGQGGTWWIGSGDSGTAVRGSTEEPESEEEDPMEEDSQATALATQATGDDEFGDTQETEFGGVAEEALIGPFPATQDTATSEASTASSRRRGIRRRNRRYSSPKKWRRMIRTRRLRSILLLD